MMANVNGSSFLTFFFLFLFFFSQGPSVICMGETSNHLSVILSSEELVQDAGYGEEKLSSVLVTGTLLCDTCMHGHKAQVHTSAVAGALVGVKCKTGRKSAKVNYARGTTDEYGDFIIDLPSHLHAIPKLNESCMIRVLRLPRASPCRRGIHSGRSRGIRLSSVGNGIRTYTSGTIRLQWRSGTSSICLKKGGYTSEVDESW